MPGMMVLSITRKGLWSERLHKSNCIVNDSDCGNVGMADSDGEQNT